MNLITLSEVSANNMVEWESYFHIPQFIENAKKVASIFNQFKDRKIYFFGNGASAAISSHLAADVFKVLKIRTGVIHDPSILTCFANDFGYENIFEKYLEYEKSSNDLVILISSSGRSSNIIKVARYAKENHSTVISLTGLLPSPELKKYTDFLIQVNSKYYNILECIHMSILCCAVDILNPIKMK
jgi:D-sedoheptulose 7-phosphate isomerase